MKILKMGLFLISALLIISCSKKEGADTTNQIKELQTQTVEENKVEYLDSIGDVTAQIEYLKDALALKRADAKSASFKRDSIKGLLQQVEASLAKVNTNKIEPGIKGVNTKLNELKGQKENLQEQLSLQKQEIVLTEKKIGLLNEEKVVYDAQRKVLWDKGAPPADFTEVDGLLAGIDSKMSEQKTRLKNLNRNVSDIEEQITIIGEQRESLSTKIRNNYTAKQIFDDYSKEEKDRLNVQLTSVDEKLTALLSEEAELNSQLAKLTGEKSDFEIKQSELTEEVKAQELALTQAELDEKAAAKKTRITYAIVAIGLITMLILAFYLLGKYKKSRKK